MHYFREYTSRIQSERLIKAGVPLYTANAVLTENDVVCPFSSKDPPYDPKEMDDQLLPAWSAFRLMLILQYMPRLPFFRYSHDTLFEKNIDRAPGAIIDELVTMIVLIAGSAKDPFKHITKPFKRDPTRKK